MKPKDKKNSLLLPAVACMFVFLIIIMGIKWLNAATVQNRIITPKPGVECVVVSASDSVSVACWKKANKP